MSLVFETFADQELRCREQAGDLITTRCVSEGFPDPLRQTQKHNPSLTQRVGIVATRATSKRVSEGLLFESGGKSSPSLTT
jgi:hypothetical protein